MVLSHSIHMSNGERAVLVAAIAALLICVVVALLAGRWMRRSTAFNPFAPATLMLAACSGGGAAALVALARFIDPPSHG